MVLEVRPSAWIDVEPGQRLATAPSAPLRVLSASVRLAARSAASQPGPRLPRSPRHTRSKGVPTLVTKFGGGGEAGGGGGACDSTEEMQKRNIH